MLAQESYARQLAACQFVIVDELHSFAGNKRGADLTLSLERLERLRLGQAPLCRVGLSATAAPLDLLARFLVGEESRLPGRGSADREAADRGSLLAHPPQALSAGRLHRRAALRRAGGVDPHPALGARFHQCALGGGAARVEAEGTAARSGEANRDASRLARSECAARGGGPAEGRRTARGGLLDQSGIGDRYRRGRSGRDGGDSERRLARHPADRTLRAFAESQQSRRARGDEHQRSRGSDRDGAPRARARARSGAHSAPAGRRDRATHRGAGRARADRRGRSVRAHSPRASVSPS